ncbi:hypothetical protein NG2371_01868 [Nocardia gamkensis]|nr:hypothetical protein [Nocardia gamkensis]
MAGEYDGCTRVLGSQYVEFAADALGRCRPGVGSCGNRIVGGQSQWVRWVRNDFVSSLTFGGPVLVVRKFRSHWHPELVRDRFSGLYSSSHSS